MERLREENERLLAQYQQAQPAPQPQAQPTIPTPAEIVDMEVEDPVKAEEMREARIMALNDQRRWEDQAVASIGGRVRQTVGDEKVQDPAFQQRVQQLVASDPALAAQGAMGVAFAATL